jgi:uncharacterized protein (TIGR02266 family)
LERGKDNGLTRNAKVEVAVEPTILLVDDVQMYLEIQNDFLKYTGIKVVTAKDGLDALEIVKADRPSLVFMDLQMPRMDGAACCRAIKADSELHTTPVVMITLKGKKEDEDACHAAGCDHYLTKPLDRDRFLDVTRRFIPHADRREKRAAATIAGNFRADGTVSPCTIRNVSAGGVFIETDRCVNPGGVVQLSFTMPGETVIECYGTVIWANRVAAKHPVGMGVKFGRLSKQAEEALRDFVGP